MPDYGRRLELSVSAGSPGRAARIARVANGAGVGLLRIRDHPYQVWDYTGRPRYT